VIAAGTSTSVSASTSASTSITTQPLFSTTGASSSGYFFNSVFFFRVHKIRYLPFMFDALTNNDGPFFSQEEKKEEKK